MCSPIATQLPMLCVDVNGADVYWLGISNIWNMRTRVLWFNQLLQYRLSTRLRFKGDNKLVNQWKRERRRKTEIADSAVAWPVPNLENLAMMQLDCYYRRRTVQLEFLNLNVTEWPISQSQQNPTNIAPDLRIQANQTNQWSGCYFDMFRKNEKRVKMWKWLRLRVVLWKYRKLWLFLQT